MHVGEITGERGTKDPPHCFQLGWSKKGKNAAIGGRVCSGGEEVTVSGKKSCDC